MYIHDCFCTFGAGKGNRTPVYSLENCRSAIELYPQSHFSNRIFWSGRRDSNSRPPAPKAGTLANCATPRDLSTITLDQAFFVTVDIKVYCTLSV